MSARNEAAIIELKHAIRSLLILCVIFFGFDKEACVSGQAAIANASMSATILEPIHLANVRDMKFGNISAGETPGTVILSPTAASSRTTTGGVTLPSGSGTVQSAKFIISGEAALPYSIVLPSETIILSNGLSLMTIGSFTSDPPGSGIMTSGSESIYIGATLNVNANQEPGIYKSTKDFEITVNYN